MKAINIPVLALKTKVDPNTPRTLFKKKSKFINLSNNFFLEIICLSYRSLAISDKKIGIITIIPPPTSPFSVRAMYKWYTFCANSINNQPTWKYKFNWILFGSNYTGFIWAFTMAGIAINIKEFFRPNLLVTYPNKIFPMSPPTHRKDATQDAWSKVITPDARGDSSDKSKAVDGLAQPHATPYPIVSKFTEINGNNYFRFGLYFLKNKTFIPTNAARYWYFALCSAIVRSLLLSIRFTSDWSVINTALISIAD